MNVKVIRISTGEEVVFDLIEETDETYVVENALFAVPHWWSNGICSLGTLIKNGDSISIKKSFVVYIGELRLKSLSNMRRSSHPLKLLVKN